MRHVDGAPMGTRGGISVVHTFPADGEYVVKMSLHNEPLGGIYGRTTMATMDIKEQIEVSVNGERAALLDLNPRMSETGSEEQPRDQDAADSHRRPGRSASPRRSSSASTARSTTCWCRSRTRWPTSTSASASPRCRTCAT